MLTDDTGVIDIVNRHCHAGGVIIQIVIHFLMTGSKCVDLHTRVDILFSAVDDAALCHFNIGINIHFCMNTQVLQVRLCQQGTNSVRHAANTQLQAGAVWNHLDNLFCHGQIHFGGRLGVRHTAHIWILHFYNRVNFGNRNTFLITAKAARQLRVHFHDDVLCTLEDRVLHSTGRTKAEVAVFVHGRNLAHCYIDGRQLIAVVAGHFREAVRHGGNESFGSIVTLGTCVEPGINGKVVLRVRNIKNFRCFHFNADTNFYVLQVWNVFCQSNIQIVYGTAVKTVVHPVAGFDSLYRFVSGRQFLCIFFLKTHEYQLPFFFKAKIALQMNCAAC